MLGWLSTASISDLSNVALLGVTAAVSAFGVYQFIATTKFNRDQAAKAIHADYIRLAMEKPTFANPSIVDVDYGSRTFAGSREEFEKYEWFVSFMVLSFEEIFHLSKTPTWENTIRSNLSFHSAYFSSPHFRESGYIENIDPALREMLPSSLHFPENHNTSR